LKSSSFRGRRRKTSNTSTRSTSMPCCRRSTWTEGAAVKAKKQDRVVGFFWESFRRNYISPNPALFSSCQISVVRLVSVPRSCTCSYNGRSASHDDRCEIDEFHGADHPMSMEEV
jgi:hypothetical protein